MAWTFPSLKRPAVFIAAPGDVEYLRQAAILEFEALTRQVADDHAIEVYDYRYQIGEDGFKDWIPAQGQIPLPSDPKCRAVVCVLGERIGTPLPHDFDVFALGRLADYEANGSRLVHPWVDGAEERGGFALTGTIFEYLAACRANDGEGRPPVLLLLVGGELARTDPDPLVADWGGGKYLADVTEDFRREHGPRAKRALADWESRHYYPQIRQLINLRRYLEGRGRVPKYVIDEEQARARIRNFLRDALDLVVHDAARTPFKGLEAYAQGDMTVFFGREAERVEAIGRLTQLWNDLESPTFFGVIGDSGVGKSSFARAALVGHLCHHTSDGRYVGCVMRPADLLAPAEGTEAAEPPPQPLRRVYELALAAVDRDADARDFEAFDMIRPEHQPAWVLDRLVTRLRERGRQWRLLLAFDQFEELLDQRTQPEGEALWAPVVELIERAARNDATGVIYTLQPNREELICRDPRLEPLWAHGNQVRLSFPLQSLERIIREPFRVAHGIEVERAVVDQLQRRISAFAESFGRGSQGSLLPLVSLTLTRIFHRCRDAVLERAAQPDELPEGIDGQAAAADPPAGERLRRRTPPALLLSDCEGLLDIEAAIAQLAEDAVAEASSGASADWSDDVVGSLLRRLVRMSDANSDRVELVAAALPARGPVRRLADALMKRRLLIREPAGRARLVHEAVVGHWSKAAAWRVREQQTLRLVGALGYRVAEWHGAAHPADIVAAASPRDVDEVAEVLAKWGDVLTDEHAREADAGLARLRDYGMALLEASLTPLRVVAGSERLVCHVHLAAWYGALDLLRRYIQADGRCVHAQQGKDGRTPVFAAAFAGRLDLIECLLEAGARADAVDAEGWQPLHAAASTGQWRVIERLEEVGVDVDAPGGPSQATALGLAAMNGHLDVVRGLLARTDCSPDKAGRYGWTPLHMAASSGQGDVLRLLHGSGRVSVDARLENGYTPLHAAAEEGHGEPIRILREFGADPDARANNDFLAKEERDKRDAGQHGKGSGWTPLHLAVSRKHAAAVGALLRGQGPADIDAATDEGDTALKLAVASGDVALLRTVLAFGPDLSGRDDRARTPLQALIMKGQLDLALALHEAGMDLDAPLGDGTLLHAVVRDRAEAKLRFLLHRGVDVHARCRGNRTALHLACGVGSPALARLLVGSGADLDALDDHRRAPLHEAATDPRQLAVLEWLVGLGRANLDAADADGLTALHLSARCGHAEAIGTLLGANAKVDARDADGWTPLMLAAQGGHDAAVSALIAANADVHAVAERPAMTALQAAAEAGHVTTIDRLLAGGSRIDAASADRPRALVMALRNGWFAAALRLLDREAAPSIDPAGRSSLVALVRERQRRLASAGLPVPDESFELLARLGSTASALQRAILCGVPLQQAAAALAPADSERDRSAALPSGHSAAILSVHGLMHYPWTPATARDRADLIARANPVRGKWPLGDSSAFHAVGLPWYDGVSLIRITDATWNLPGLAIYHLLMPDADASHRAISQLDGTSAPIHEVNAKAPIRLDASNVLGYLKFFCHFVRGEEGPFHVLESLDDPIIPRDASGRVLEVLRHTVRPAAVDGVDDQGRFRCDAVIWYSNAIFIANLAVSPNGMVEMINDEPVAADLPVRIHSPI